jgi:transposase
MRRRRTFTKELKRQVVEEILAGVSTPAQICRRYTIAYPLIARWRERYAKGKLDNEPQTPEAKIEQLEQIIGHLTVDNQVLKKALKHALLIQDENGNSSAKTSPSLGTSEGGVKC